MKTIPWYVYALCLFTVLAALWYRYSSDRLKRIGVEILFWCIVACIFVVLTLLCLGAFQFAMGAG